MNYLPNPLLGPKLNVIVYCTEKQVNGKQFLKYTIDNSFAGIDRFIKFAAKFPGARHINFYSKRTLKFIEQYKY